MDAENKPAENVTEAAGPATSDKSVARWRLILLVLCAVGVGLVGGILALQVAEYLFYKAPPDVWPQPGAAGRSGRRIAIDIGAVAFAQCDGDQFQVGKRLQHLIGQRLILLGVKSA